MTVVAPAIAAASTKVPGPFFAASSLVVSSWAGAGVSTGWGCGCTCLLIMIGALGASEEASAGFCLDSGDFPPLLLTGVECPFSRTDLA
jgi:hypothetical protein